MDGGSLREKIIYWAKSTPDKPVVIEAEGGRSISYADFLSGAISFGNYLGAKPLTIIAAIPGGILDSIIWVAALVFGHVLIPVSPALTEFEYKELISKHNPDILIVDASLKFASPKNIKRLNLSGIGQIVKNGKGLKFPQKKLPEGGVYLSTSGTTGEPKGIVLSSSKIVITAQNIIDSHKLTAVDKGLTPLPFYHVNAPVVSLVSSILSGGTVVIAPKYSTSRFWEWVEAYNPTWISIVPTIAAMLLGTERTGFLDNNSLRFIRTASSPLPVIILERFEKKFKIPLIETYGITEAASTITANPVPPRVHKTGSVGLPIGIDLRIFDPEKLIEVPQGKTGEVWVKGPQVISHYEGNKDADSFHEGWFRTGDLGYMDNDGYVFLTGRKKEIIIRGGENIAPREIEEVILTFPNVRECAVVGLPDELYGEEIAAFVAFDDKKNKSNPDALKKYAAKKLSKQKIPSDIFILDELPKGKTGKIDKNALKKYTVS